MKRLLSLVLVLLLLYAFSFCVTADTKPSAYSSNDISASQGDVAENTVDYQEYISRLSDKGAGKDNLILSVKDAVWDGQIIQNVLETGKDGILLKEATAAFSFTVTHSGLYNIAFEYYSGYEQAVNTDYEISITVDGEALFSQCNDIRIPRVWQDEEVGCDSKGNELLPKRTQKSGWYSEYFYDYERYTATPLCLYLSEGTHIIKVSAAEVDFVLGGISLTPAKELISYDTYIDALVKDGKRDADESYIFEAEKTAAKSVQSISQLNDRTSPNTTPYHSYLVKMNTIGGDKWKNSGEWIEWEIDIPQDGLYTIALRFKQDQKENSFSSRALYIDGEIPFSEAAELSFEYDSSWQLDRLGGEEPYRFYFTKGKHTLRMEVNLGKSADLVQQVNLLIAELNDTYLDVVMVTGVDPDMGRDYKFDKMIPETIEKMRELSKRLKEIEEMLLKQSGEGSNTAYFHTLCTQLDKMTDKPANIASTLSAFKEAISALANWQSAELLQPLEIDKLIFSPESEKLPKAHSGFFKTLIHHLKQLILSYSEDYNSLEETEIETESSIKVWLSSGGRDQAQVIRQMTKDFTASEKIGVVFQLVNGGSLLPATLAGIGPDVALSQGQSDPVNFALRNAVVDLSKMEDFDTVIGWFDESAVKPFRLEGGVYALPEAQGFPMLFVRTDVMRKLNISLESFETWEDIFESVLAKLQNNYLEFGFSSGMDGFSMLFLQRGGEYYSEKGEASLLNSTEAVSAFSEFTELFTDYKQPLSFDFSNRFRSGEMPVAVASLGSYNQLEVFAPEIKGSWVMLPIPGTRREDGTVDRTIVATVSGCIIMQKSENKQAAWSFIKWWCSAEIQASYANEMEILLGASGRYMSANNQAFDTLSWDRITKSSIDVQRQWLDNIPEVAGGYYTSRHFSFAFREVVYESREPREALNSAVVSINKEIKNKREEFGLD
ncbi:MAG: extracellular solute-binding protein [Clostridia bacterium]|nr:extracellular solute-binding protein [Clostridia bacterium]